MVSNGQSKPTPVVAAIAVVLACFDCLIRHYRFWAEETGWYEVQSPRQNKTAPESASTTGGLDFVGSTSSPGVTYTEAGQNPHQLATYTYK